MKYRLFIASMLWLFAMKASAQKTYTGTISFPALGISFQINNVDNSDSDEVDRAERFLYGVVKSTYGVTPSLYWYKVENSARSLSQIVIEPLNQALKNPFIKNLPTNMGDLVVYGKLKETRYKSTSPITDLRIIDLENHTIFDPETGKLKRFKSF